MVFIVFYYILVLLLNILFLNIIIYILYIYTHKYIHTHAYIYIRYCVNFYLNCICLNMTGYIYMNDINWIELILFNAKNIYV